MPKRLRWQIPLILLLVGLSLYFTFPLRQRINLGLDLQGGMHLVLRVDTSAMPEEARADATARAVEIIRNRRLDPQGLREPLIQRQGADRIVIQLPGVTDRERALAILGQTALLELKLVAEDPSLLQEALGGSIPAGYELAEDEDGSPLLLESRTILTGSALADAQV